MREIEERRSIRKYRSEPIPPEKVEALIDSAIAAPSGSNTQPWHFILVEEEGMRAAVTAAAHDQKWMLTAPLFIVCVADIGVRIKDTAGLVLGEASSLPELKLIIRDTALAIESMALEAVSLGLGSCCVARFEQEGIRAVLGIPPDKYVVCVLTVGYPDERPAKRSRKEKAGLVHRNRW